MRVYTFAILFVMLIISCRAKNSSETGIEDDLKKAMQFYLYNAINNDSSNVKYHVQGVTFSEDKNKYICKFRVNLKAKLFDTTGIMKANVSRDFKKVERLN